MNPMVAISSPQLNVYRDWLGIEEDARPLNHYQLLGLRMFEDDPSVIRARYRELNEEVRKYASGKYGPESQALLNELAQAMLCLTDAVRKTGYDTSLGRAAAERMSEIIAAGTPSLDLFVVPTALRNGLAKVPCEVRKSYGGGAVNAARAARNYYGNVSPLLFVPTDRQGDYAVEELGDEFPNAVFERFAGKSRLSVILGDVCYTVRRDVPLKRLSQRILDRLAAAGIVIVGPFGAANNDLVAAALSAAKFSIWQPSTQQIADRASFHRLANLATITVMNSDEARLATGEVDPIEQVKALSEHIHRGLMVTSRFGVHARIDGQWAFAPARVVERVVTTTGPGDTFVGVFAAALAQGRPLQEALALGQLAAARHVQGLPQLSSLDQLPAWSSGGKSVKYEVVPSPRVVRRRRRLALAGFATAAALLLMLFIAAT